MQVKQLLTEDRAVSPVIGVILMVAITVILAAVIGTFVLGLGQNVQSTPQASFNFDFNGSGGVDITHEGGDRLNAGDNTKFVNVTSTDGNTAVWVETADNPVNGSSGSVDSQTSIGAGSTFGGYEYGDSGATVRVTWTGENGQSTATLGSAEAP